MACSTASADGYAAAPACRRSSLRLAGIADRPDSLPPLLILSLTRPPARGSPCSTAQSSNKLGFAPPGSPSGPRCSPAAQNVHPVLSIAPDRDPARIQLPAACRRQPTDPPPLPARSHGGSIAAPAAAPAAAAAAPPEATAATAAVGQLVATAAAGWHARRLRPCIPRRSRRAPGRLWLARWRPGRLPRAEAAARALPHRAGARPPGCVRPESAHSAALRQQRVCSQQGQSAGPHRTLSACGHPGHMFQARTARAAVRAEGGRRSWQRLGGLLRCPLSPPSRLPFPPTCSKPNLPQTVAPRVEAICERLRQAGP